jgi:hypothetical protein
MGVLETEIVYNFGQMIADMGRAVTVRQVTTLAGPAALPNPPSYAGLVVNGAALAGAAVVNFRGTQINGRLLAGDTFTVGANTYTVNGGVNAASNHFTAVGFAPALAAPLADGDPVALTFAADVTLNALASSFPARAVNGTTIQATDQQVRFRASDIPWQPTITDKIILGGDQYSVVTVRSLEIQGVVYAYALQARR